jgi:hypothetical protein
MSSIGVLRVPLGARHVMRDVAQSMLRDDLLGMRKTLICADCADAGKSQPTEHAARNTIAS